MAQLDICKTEFTQHQNKILQLAIDNTNQPNIDNILQLDICKASHQDIHTHEHYNTAAYPLTITKGYPRMMYNYVW